MRIRNNSVFSVLFRYIILLLLALFISYSKIAYNALLLLTIYPVNALLGAFYSSSIASGFIISADSVIELIPACVAVSAYLLLLVLNFVTPMNLKKRVYSLFFSVFLLLIINIIRIVLLACLFISNNSNFEFIHKIIWHALSIIIVAGIWFLTAYLFKIKSIPIYTDFKLLIENKKC